MSEQSERIFDAMTGVGGDLIEKAQETRRARRRARVRWIGPAAAVLAAAILIGVLSGKGAVTTYAITEAEYPKAHTRGDPGVYSGALDGFLTASIPEFLSGADGKNRVYSPLNVYMALSMLAELSDGNTRAQILSLLGADDIAAQRERAKALWHGNYYTGERGECLLANSLWLNRDIAFVQSTMETLAKDYYASSYRGEMGSAGFDRALQSWLNKQTGGLLKEQAGGVRMPADTVMAIASTIFFKGTWSSEFNPSATSADVFHAPGGDLTCDYMHGTKPGPYYWGERFSAVRQYFSNNRSMYFILPDADSSPDALLEDAEFLAFLTAGRVDWANQKDLTIRLTVPKFDVVSDIDLLPGLAALGVTDALDPAVSDFTLMTKDDALAEAGIYVSQAKHAARVAVDEEGCVAVAYTVIGMSGGTMPPEETVDFTLDRPFLFVISGPDGLPLFVGVVNRPAA